MNSDHKKPLSHSQSKSQFFCTVNYHLPSVNRPQLGRIGLITTEKKCKMHTKEKGSEGESVDDKMMVAGNEKRNG